MTQSIKDKPEPLSPVIHMTHPFWLSNFCLSSFPTGHSCHTMFVDFPTVDKNWLDAPILTNKNIVRTNLQLSGNSRPQNKVVVYTNGTLSQLQPADRLKNIET